VHPEYFLNGMQSGQHLHDSMHFRSSGSDIRCVNVHIASKVSDSATCCLQGEEQVMIGGCNLLVRKAAKTRLILSNNSLISIDLPVDLSACNN